MKQLIDGIEIIGKTKDSGYTNPIYLIKTKEKNFIQLTQLLFHTVIALKKYQTIPEIAVALTKLEGKEVDEKATRFLIEEKLEPLGIVRDTHVVFDAKRDKTGIKAPELLLGLKNRITLFPEHIVERIATVFKPFFWPPLMISISALLLLMNIWLFVYHGISQALLQTINEPFLFLMIFALLLISTLFHEFGHAAACSYGGGRPGKIGAGIYLVWPAFFTDISDVYRLDRIAKLRSDIGGIYFNLIFSLIIAGIYFFTQFQPLLILIFLQNIEVLHQLLPFLRLDGYFIVSDIVGLPDLFMRIGSIIKSFIPGQQQKTVSDLKPWVRWTVTLWVISTIGILIFFLGSSLLHAPQIFLSAWQSAERQFSSIKISLVHAEYIVAFISILQLIFLLLPTLGLGYMFTMLSRKGLSGIFLLAGNSRNKKILLTVGLLCELAVIIYFLFQ